MPDSYIAAMDRFRIAPDLPACGTSAYYGQPVTTADVERDALWSPWLQHTRNADFRACWSFPMKTLGGQVLGTFALYFREPRVATEHDRDLAADITDAAAIIISRYNVVQERKLAEKALQEQVATAGQDGLAIVWNSETGQAEQRLDHEGVPVRAVAFNDKGNRLATGDEEGQVKLWNLSSGSVSQRLNDHSAAIYDLAFSPDSSYLATASQDGTAILWDAATGRAQATLPGHTGTVSAVATSTAWIRMTVVSCPRRRWTA